MTKLEIYFSANGHQFDVVGENKTGRDFANFASAFKELLENFCKRYTEHFVNEKEILGKEVTSTDSAELISFRKGYFDVDAVIRYADQYVNVFTPSVRLSGWENKIVVRIMKNEKDSCGGMNNTTNMPNLFSTISSVATRDAIYNINGKYYTHRQLLSKGNEVASLWGGTCNKYEIKRDDKQIIFHCCEHGEEFVTTISFDEI